MTPTIPLTTLTCKQWVRAVWVILSLCACQASWAGAGDYCKNTEIQLFRPTIVSLSNPQKFIIEVVFFTMLSHRTDETASCVVTTYPRLDLDNGLTLKSELTDSATLFCNIDVSTDVTGKGTVTTYTIDKTKAVPYQGYIGCAIQLSYTWVIEGIRDESIARIAEVNTNMGNLVLDENQPSGRSYGLSLNSSHSFWMPPLMRCTSTPDQTITVDLGKIPASKFAKVGDASSEVEFTMRWIGCYDKTTQHQLYDNTLQLHTVNYPAYAMSMQMDFTPIANNESLMANTIDKDKGGATGLALEVIDKTTQATISNGVPFDLESAYSTGSTARTFSARLKSTAAKVTPGQFKSIATYTVTYK